MRLRPLFDVTVLLDVPPAVLRKRLFERWRQHRLTPNEIAAKLEDSDLPNGRRVMSESLDEDFRLTNG